MEEEKRFVCPYNNAHAPKVSRMQQHLKRCRDQCGGAQMLKTCPFNSTHIVANSELDLHMEYCENRISFDAHYIKLSSNHELYHKPTPFSAPESHVTDECWSLEEARTDVSIIEKCRQSAMAKPTLTNKIGAPKSERKAHRIQERLRFASVAGNFPKQEPNEELINDSHKESWEDDNRQLSSRGAIPRSQTDSSVCSRVLGTGEVERNVNLPFQQLSLRGGEGETKLQGSEYLDECGPQPTTSNTESSIFGWNQNNSEERRDPWKAKDSSSLGGNKRDPNNPWKINTSEVDEKTGVSGTEYFYEQQPATIKSEPPLLSEPAKTKDGRDPTNPWKIKNSLSSLRNSNENNDLPVRDVIRGTTKETSALGFQEKKGDGRDPTNPWKIKNSPNDADNSPQVESFPFLPVAGRGRGRKFRK